MAKVGKVKVRQPSAHSRAARRAEPIDINTDKSLKEVSPLPAPTTPKPTTDILAARTGSGVSKKPKTKPLTRAQRLRKEKGMQRAEAVVDQLETKVKQSKESARNIKERASAWEELNNPVKESKRERRKEEKVVGALEKGRKKGRGKSGEDGQEEWEDVDGGIEMEVDQGVLTTKAAEGHGMEVVMSQEMDGVDAIT